MSTGSLAATRPPVVLTSKMKEPQSSEHEIPTPKGEIEPLDLSPFIRGRQSEPVLQDQWVIQQQALKKAEEIRQFRQLKEEILKQREQEQNARNLQKQNVLQMYEDLQISLDSAREQTFSAQEAYRRKLLETEKRKQEVNTAEEANGHLEEDKKPLSAQKRKSAKSGKRK